jgi:hypothetical protein
MTLLEIEDNGSGVPQGVVLAIVGPSLDALNPGKETETARTARMYNLTSLVNLARWTISQKACLHHSYNLIAATDHNFHLRARNHWTCTALAAFKSRVLPKDIDHKGVLLEVSSLSPTAIHQHQPQSRRSHIRTPPARGLLSN